MSDYEVGYGKPPKASQFKAGTSGNPKGRPKRRPSSLTAVIPNVLNAPIRHQEGGREKMTPAWLLKLRMQIKHALHGDEDAALSVLTFWRNAARSTSGRQRIEIADWLPDYPGQTAEEKTREYAQKSNLSEAGWWSEPSTVKKTSNPEEP